ncbi:hypothetical protein [Azospirillum melinis]
MGRVRGSARNLRFWILALPLTLPASGGSKAARKSRDRAPPTITFGARPAYGRRLCALSRGGRGQFTCTKEKGPPHRDGPSSFNPATA